MKSEPLSEEALAAIEAREQAATPGPWKGDPEPYAIYIYGADSSPVADTMVPGKYSDDPREKPNFEDGERGGVDAVLRLRGVGASRDRPKGSLVNNYKFMIHAREDVRVLCAEVRRLNALIDELLKSRGPHTKTT